MATLGQPAVQESATTGWWWLLLLFILTATAAYWWWRQRRRLVSDEQALLRARRLTFLQITVPHQQRAGEENERDYRSLLSVVEPFLATVAGLSDQRALQKRAEPPTVSLEIIAKKGEIYFFMSAEPALIPLLERQLHSQYPAAQIERTDNFKLFEGQDWPFDAAQLTLVKPFMLPLKTYRELESDPLNGLTSALSKMDPSAKGVIQLLLRPVEHNWQKEVAAAVKRLSAGEEMAENAGPQEIFTTMKEAVIGNKSSKKEDDSTPKISANHQRQIELLQEKGSKQALLTEIRVVITAQEATAPSGYLNTVLAAFNQFSAPDRNRFRVLSRPADSVMREFVLRRFTNRGQILSTEEVASIFHLPNRFTDTPSIHWLSSRRLAPPVNLPREGTTIGRSRYRGEDIPINILPDDRLRHLYAIGKTGVGKTVLFENMIQQDILAGHGVAYLDPNGDAIEWILGHIPKSRAEDVIYFNPADMSRPFGLNLLEWKKPSERDFLIQEALAIFYKLFDPGQTGIVGPQFEHWFRNAALTLMSDPAGGTLVEIPRLFIDPAFERAKVANVTDPVVRAFWEKQLAQTSAASKSEMLNYFISKFGRFMTNDMMRNIIGQTSSSFDFRAVMDERKILLVNLSKGLIGELNAQLLGMILVAKLQMAAFSRQDIAESARIPFYLYVDEFQNFTTDTFATILSEARKYRLSLSITNQYVAQLSDRIREAVVGNVGTLISFRVGAADAEWLLHEFDGLTMEDLVHVEKQHFYIKTLVDNAPTGVFTGVSSDWSPDTHEQLAAALKELSRLKHGRDGAAVNTAILARSRVDQLPIAPPKSNMTST